MSHVAVAKLSLALRAYRKQKNTDDYLITQKHILANKYLFFDITVTHLGALPSSEEVEEILFPNRNALLVVRSLKFKFSPNITIRLLNFPFNSKALQHEVSCYLIFYLPCFKNANN